jgi:D-amino peptidase
MRKLFVCADMEGAGAVSSQHALTPDRWEWAAARKWMTEEVIAVAQVAAQAGYGEVIVADSHGNAHNIDPDALPDNVRLIRSWPRPLLMMEGVQTDGVDACMLIGHHGGASASGSVLAHTFSLSFRAVVLNDVVCSEGYLGAALAGELGRPVVFVSGDQHTVEDALRYAPDAVRFATKHSLGWRSQSALPPGQVRGMMKEHIARALNSPLPPPFVLRGPFRLELDMTNQVAPETLSYLPGFERLDAWRVAATFDSMSAVMRFLSFAVFYSPTGAITY